MRRSRRVSQILSVDVRLGRVRQLARDRDVAAAAARRRGCGGSAFQRKLPGGSTSPSRTFVRLAAVDGDLHQRRDVEQVVADDAVDAPLAVGLALADEVHASCRRARRSASSRCRPWSAAAACSSVWSQMLPSFTYRNVPGIGSACASGGAGRDDDDLAAASASAGPPGRRTRRGRWPCPPSGMSPVPSGVGRDADDEQADDRQRRGERHAGRAGSGPPRARAVRRRCAGCGRGHATPPWAGDGRAGSDRRRHPTRPAARARTSAARGCGPGRRHVTDLQLQRLHPSEHPAREPRDDIHSIPFRQHVPPGPAARTRSRRGRRVPGAGRAACVPRWRVVRVGP